MCNIASMRKLLALFLVLLLASCSLPFGKKPPKEAQPTKTEKGEVVTGTEQPKPGDVRLVNGIEYIYARNRRFQLTPYEPEYEWVRKDDYSAGLFDSMTDKLTGSSAAKKERAEMDTRMARLEERLKQRSTPAQGRPPAQQAGFQGPYMVGRPGAVVGFTFPSPKMKRRVLVLPLVDQTNYKEEHLEELTTKRLLSRLEDTGTIIAVDLPSLELTGDPLKPEVMRSLYDLYGIEAVIKGTLSDVYSSTSKMDGKEDKEVSFALSKISLDIYNTETGKLLRQLSARNPFYLSKENGDLSSEKAKVRAIDLAIELMADDLLKTLLNLDWHARVASVENDRVYINAGRLSGLQKGDVLEVYAPGDAIVDKTTTLTLGRIKGAFKGEIEVMDVFGVDASWAKAGKDTSFGPTDLVYLKQR